MITLYQPTRSYLSAQYTHSKADISLRKTIQKPTIKGQLLQLIHCHFISTALFHCTFHILHSSITRCLIVHALDQQTVAHMGEK